MNQEALNYFLKQMKLTISAYADTKKEDQYCSLGIQIEGIEEHIECTTNAEFKIIGDSLIVTEEWDVENPTEVKIIEINKIILIEEI